MKKPIALFCTIITVIVMLSVMFPSDPTKPDIISRIKHKTPPPSPNLNVSNDYMITGINKLTGSGKAIAWSKDEKYIYYSTDVKDSDEPGLEELRVCDMNGEKRTIDTDIKLYNINNAKWSPDGSMLAFISTNDDRNNLMIYNINDGSIKDITPKKVTDTGVTSYDWDDDSMSIIMSVDISNPRIEIYSFKTGKSVRLDISPVSCRNVAFYRDNRIIYSDILEGRYKILSADRSGKNPSLITEGWEFKVSPDRHKIAIMSDGDGQRGLWVYYTSLNERKELSHLSVYDAYWTNDSSNLLYSIEEDSRNNYIYKGYIYYYNKDMKTINIRDAVYNIFLPSDTGNKIAMTSPEFFVDKEEEMGIFIGDLYKQP